MRKFENNVFKEGTRYDPVKVKEADTNPKVAEDSRKRPVTMIEDYQRPINQSSPKIDVRIPQEIKTIPNENNDDQPKSQLTNTTAIPNKNGSGNKNDPSKSQLANTRSGTTVTSADNPAFEIDDSEMWTSNDDNELRKEAKVSHNPMISIVNEAFDDIHAPRISLYFDESREGNELENIAEKQSDPTEATDKHVKKKDTPINTNIPNQDTADQNIPKGRSRKSRILNWIRRHLVCWR